MISAEQIFELAPGCKPEIVDSITPYLIKWAPAFCVTTPLRTAHLMAQLAYESAGFSRLEENLNYTSAPRIRLVWPHLKWRAKELVGKPEALANAAYGFRLGNGDEASGDGWRFRGRGLIQLTGRDNYRARSPACGIDLIAQPDSAADPNTTVMLALSFWNSRGCNRAADSDDVSEVTQLINGPELCGLAQRRALTKRAKKIFV